MESIIIKLNYNYVLYYITHNIDGEMADQLYYSLKLLQSIKLYYEINCTIKCTHIG